MAKKNILVVDDDKGWVRMLTERLEYEGYHVDVAFDTLNGVAQAIKLKPDLILLDILMPAGGGIIALKNIRESSITFNIPVIVITGRLDIETKEKAEKLGISDYFLKPIDSSKLMNRIREILDKNAP